MNVHRSFIFLLCALAAIICSACAPTVHTLTEMDNGSALECSVGDIISISLPANPTTGYAWTTRGFPSPAVLVLTQDEFIAAGASPTAVGVPGRQVFTYEVTGAGKEGIRLAYIRPWVKQSKPAGQFELLVKSR